MAFGIGAPGQSPEAHSGRGPVQDARRIPRPDAADHPPGAGRHHAHVGQHQPRADDPTSGCSTTRTSPPPSAPTTRPTSTSPAARTTPQQPVAPVPLGQPRPRPVRPPRLRARGAARSGADLGLYSVTFNNDLAHDLATLERFHEFREEAERKGFRYFLEVFDPNVPGAVAPERLAPLHQRHDRPDARGRRPGGPAALPQDRLSRPEGDGGAGPLRPAPRRRHPRRLGRHHARRLPAPRTTPRNTGPRSPSSAARSTTPRTSSPSSSSSA